MTTKIWIALVVLTLMTFLAGYLKLVSSFVVVLLLISILIKGQLIIDNFMGLKNVEWKYRMIPSIWLILVVSSIAYFYYIPL